MKLFLIFYHLLLFLFISNLGFGDDWVENSPHNSKKPIEVTVPKNSTIIVDCIRWLESKEEGHRWEVGIVEYLNGNLKYKSIKNNNSIILLVDKNDLISIECFTPDGQSMDLFAIKININDKLRPDNHLLYLDYHESRYKFY